MAKRKITEQDFKKNPDLFNKHHFVIGDEVDLDALNDGDEKVKVGNAKGDRKRSATDEENETFESGGNGGNHPPTPPGKP